MAINVYCGLMGSGKSYEAVSSIIIPAVAAGRRVVSNIDGLNESAIHEYILSHKAKFRNKGSLTAEVLGLIEHVSNDRILQPGFFPDPEHVDGSGSVVQSGDLVVIDEAWRFWPTNAKPSYEHMLFFRMHRHYAHARTGVTSDLVLLIQDVSGLHPDLKRVVEMTVRTTKLKSLGLNYRYRVEIFEGYRLTRAAKTATYQKAYDKQIFPLYQSYGSDNAKETAVDDRQNIFKGARVWLFLVLILVLFGGGIWYLVGFFGTKSNQKVSALETVKIGVQPVSFDAKPVGKSEVKSGPSLSSEWRIVGVTLIDDRLWVVLQNASGRLRYEYRSKFDRSGQLLSGVIDGLLVTTYSGTVSRTGLLGTEK